MTAAVDRALVPVRPAVEGDKPFIFSSWLKSYRESSFARSIQSRVYFAGQHRKIEEILARPDVVVLVATTPEQPDVVVGWGAFEGGKVVHYLYVKEAFRRFGVARAICEAYRLPRAFQFTHRTNVVEAPIRARPEAVYNPYL